MRFLRKDKIEKTILVVSDLHLSAGSIVNGKRNYLEDFNHDREFVEFLEFYSSGEYSTREVELIINGDFLDFLAVPFVKFFDDEFWSEKASIERLQLIMDAHKEVFEALKDFVEGKNRILTYIIGNHDAEFVLKKTQDLFLKNFTAESIKRVKIIINDGKEYIPLKGVYIIHGHEYEMAHHFHSKKSVIQNKIGVSYFMPPWGSYWVTRVLNRFKPEKNHINTVRPIRKFIINGLIYDTLFTLRFVFATIFYFIMVRFFYFYKQEKNLKKVIKYLKNELELFKDYESITEDFFDSKEDIKLLVVGHTHEPCFRQRVDGSIFINTGTWIRMHYLDFGNYSEGIKLTYAQIDVIKNKKNVEEEELDFALNIWKGNRKLPYYEF